MGAVRVPSSIPPPPLHQKGSALQWELFHKSAVRRRLAAFAFGSHRNTAADFLLLLGEVGTDRIAGGFFTECRCFRSSQGASQLATRKAPGARGVRGGLSVL